MVTLPTKQPALRPDQVYSFPCIGNETVLNAIANGMQSFSTGHMWIARPVANADKPLILPVDWNVIAAYGAPQTNHRILPGDRVMIEAATPETAVNSTPYQLQASPQR